MEQQLKNWHYVPLISHLFLWGFREELHQTQHLADFGHYFFFLLFFFLFDPDEAGVEEFATSERVAELSGRMRP